MSARDESISDENTGDEDISNEDISNENNNDENDSNDNNRDDDDNNSDASDHSSQYEPYDGRELLCDYATFLDQLYTVDIDTLLPDDQECPMCRVPYPTSLAYYKESRDQDLSTLEELPFQPDPPYDQPVRLPCAAEHVVGRTCMIHWATIGKGKTCPKDREEMFDDLYVPKPSDCKYLGRYLEHRWERRRREIETEIPIRELLHCFRNALASEEVLIDANFMTDRLATLLIRIVYHRNGFRDRHSQINWPWITMAYPRLWEPEQTKGFRNLVLDSIRDEPLTDSGTYPPHVVDMLNPALPHIFALLYRLVMLFEAETLPFRQLAGYMQLRVKKFFHDFSEFIVDESRLYRIATLAVDLWVAQEILMTRMRHDFNVTPYWHRPDLPDNRFIHTTLFTRADIGYFKVPHVIRANDKRTVYASPTSLAMAGLIKPPKARQKTSSEIHQDDDAGSDRVIHVPEEFFNYMWDKWRDEEEALEAMESVIKPSKSQEAQPAAEPEDWEDVAARVLKPNRATIRDDLVDPAPPPLTISKDQERRFRSQRLSNHSGQSPERHSALQNELRVGNYVLRPERGYVQWIAGKTQQS